MKHLLYIITLSLLIRTPLHATKPNIVLILADDMGYSDLGCYGGEIETPQLDALAANGLRFTDFHNAARCCPTRASLLTGLYPHEAGVGRMVYRNLGPGYLGRLNDRCSTLGQVLGSAGYRTLMSGKWHVGHQDKSVQPEQRGFDRFYGTYLHVDSYFKVLPGCDIWLDGIKQIPGDWKAIPQNSVDSEQEFYTTDAYTDYAMKFLDEAYQRDEPFFLYLAYNAPHWPLEAPERNIEKYRDRYDAGWDVLAQQKFARMKKMGLLPEHTQYPAAGNTPWADVSEADRRELTFRRAIYAAMVDRMDENIGRVVDSLRAADKLNHTLILFLSDNGCSAEQGMFGYNFDKNKQANYTNWRTASGRSASQGQAWAHLSNAPFRKYKKYTHEGGSRTPLIAHWPTGIAQTGGLCHAPGHIIDIMATLCALSGTPRPEGTRGISLVPAFAGKPLSNREALYWEHEGHRAIRVGNWKLVCSFEGKAERNWELYDLGQDPTESHDRAAQHPERVAQLIAQWTAWAKAANVLPDQHQRHKKPAPKKGTVKIDPNNLATIAQPSFSTPQVGRDQPVSIQDSILPSHSGDKQTVHRSWWPQKGNAQWAQYDFKQTQIIGRVEVYWFHDHPNGGCKIPAKWRVMYRDGDHWIPVKTADVYGTKKDAFNPLRFEAVRTTGLRLEVELQPGASGGLHEWRVAKE